jgi:hypothetical protein
MYLHKLIFYKSLNKFINAKIEMTEIRKSNIWKSLNVPLTSNFKSVELINPTPTEFKLPEHIKFNDFDPEALLKFVSENNKTASGNINLFPKELFNNISGSCYTTLIKNDKIVSFALATIIPIKVSKEYDVYFGLGDWKSINTQKTLLFGYTNYLCAHKEHRDQEKGINAVKATLNYGIPRGVICGYFIGTTPKTSNYLELNNWSLPLNFAYCRTAGFPFTNYRRVKDKSELRNELHYKIKIDSKYNIQSATIDHLADFQRLSKGYTFVLSPNIFFWGKMLQMFKTYVLVENKKVVSIGSILITETLMTEKNKILKYANIVFCIGDPIILKALLLTSEKLGAHVAIGYEIGNLTASVIADSKVINSGKMYLEFYNTSLVHKPENVCVPIF